MGLAAQRSQPICNNFQGFDTIAIQFRKLLPTVFTVVSTNCKTQLDIAILSFVPNWSMHPKHGYVNTMITMLHRNSRAQWRRGNRWLFYTLFEYLMTLFNLINAVNERNNIFSSLFTTYNPPAFKLMELQISTKVKPSSCGISDWPGLFCSITHYLITARLLFSVRISEFIYIYFDKV